MRNPKIADGRPSSQMVITRGKSSKHLKTIVIPALEKRNINMLGQVSRRDKKIEQLKAKIGKLERKIERLVYVAKDARRKMPVRLQFPNRGKKVKIGVRHQKLIAKNKATRKEVNDYASEYFEKKFLAVQLRQSPMVGLFSYPITTEWLKHCGIHEKSARMLLIISNYEWFNSADMKMWGLVNTRPYTKILEDEGLINNFKINNRNAFRITEKGVEFIKQYYKYYNKVAKEIIKNNPKKDGLYQKVPIVLRPFKYYGTDGTTIGG